MNRSFLNYSLFTYCYIIALLRDWSSSWQVPQWQSGLLADTAGFMARQGICTIFIRSRLQLIFSTDYSFNFEQSTVHISSNAVIILRSVKLKVVKKIKSEERLKL